MSKIALTPNASGTGTFTLASPNSSTSRTLTLPDTTGVLLNDASSLASGKLTGALPAISGSSLTSLTSANLTGALPAIDGSALTGVGASTVLDAVGTYGLMQNQSGTASIAAGSTVAGSGLRFSSLNYTVVGTPTASGTWRVMGRFQSSGTGSLNGITVCVRIS